MKAEEYLRVLRKAIQKGHPEELRSILSPEDRTVLPAWENESEAIQEEYDRLVDLALEIIYR